MTTDPKAAVLAKFPKAFAWHWADIDHYAICLTCGADDGIRDKEIGHGYTEAEAWDSAAKRLPSNPNNCETCDHKRNPDGGWCYMFRNEPIDVCLKHTKR